MASSPVTNLPEGYSVEQPQQASTLPDGYSIEEAQQSMDPEAAYEASNPDLAQRTAHAWNQVKGGAVGFAKSAGQTAKTLVDLPETIAGAITGQPRQPDKVDQALTPNGPNEEDGAMLENIVEFALGDEALKGLSLTEKLAQGSKLAGVLEKYPRLANIIGNAIRGGAVGGAVGGIHNGVEGAEQGAEGGAVLGGGLSAIGEAASGLKGAKAVLFPGKGAAEQGVKDAIGKVLGSKADADVVQEAFNRMDPQSVVSKMISPTENELKLIKPKVTAELTQLSQKLEEVLQQSPWGEVLDAKTQLNQMFDQMIQQAKSGVGDVKETTDAVNAVRNRILPRVADDATPATVINSLKRVVGEQIKNFQPPEMLNSAGKAEQEAYRQAYFGLRDMVSEAVPESKDLNLKISRAFELQDLLDKKFPRLETAEQAQNSYKAERSKNAKGLVKSAAKTIGIGGAKIGTALEAAKILSGK
jgi:ElaB/YqjD/DUF883 family membrane-anchored ribosome-binding protein